MATLFTTERLVLTKGLLSCNCGHSQVKLIQKPNTCDFYWICYHCGKSESKRYKKPTYAQIKSKTLNLGLSNLNQRKSIFKSIFSF